jgi:hypothetical protein
VWLRFLRHVRNRIDLSESDDFDFNPEFLEHLAPEALRAPTGFGDPIRATHREAPKLPSFDNCAEPAALPED